MNKKNKRRGKMSTKNIIVNTSEPKPGILGRGDMFAIAVGIVVLLPIIFDISIVTITNIFQVITFFMNVTVVYAISRLPKKYPEAWSKNKFHLKKGGLYAFCTISIIIYTVIFMKGIFSIKPAYAVSAVIVIIAYG